ncbi:unnamed protein product [Scytosiphon promiscuus]
MTPVPCPGRRHVDARFVLALMGAMLAVADAFRTSSSSPFRVSTTPPTLPWRRPASTTRSAIACPRMTAATSTAATSVSTEVAFAPIISELQARIVDAPNPLEDNESAQRRADQLGKPFEVGGDGNLVGGFAEEVRLAGALAMDTFVVVRILPEAVRACLRRLGGAAEKLLGESRTVEEKMRIYGQMQNYNEGVVSGYAGGGHYGSDQFLETRGAGGGELVPDIDGAIAPEVIEGRRALAAISHGVLRTVVRQSLPEVDPSAFLGLVDGGEGREDGQGPRKMSSTPLRICRYAGGGDGIAFGAHTDTTFLTVIPCASAPGLEIMQPSTGRWVRPEAARKCQPGCDVMLLAGELLQVLGRGRHRAAVHRVVRPADLVEPRVSTPLLVRGRAGAVVRDSMLPPAVTDRLEGRSAESRHAGSVRDTGSPPSSTADEEGGKLTMTDLWAALQFRGGATSGAGDDDSFDDGLAGGDGGGDSTGGGSRSVTSSPPLAQAKTEEQIRRRFAPFARDGVSVLSTDPLLVRLHGFVSAEECEAIINQGSATFKESTTWGGADAQAEADVLRTSSTTWLADDSLASLLGARGTPLLESMTDSVCAMSGLPSAFMEKWQVARYRPGGFFKLHTDHVEAFNELVCGGRLGTLLLYLNDDFTGGQTDFPFVEVAVEPSAGDAIYFHSVQLPVEQEDADTMRPDERSAHAGLAVHGGDKWIATKWVHPLPYPGGRKEARESPAESFS